MPNPLYARLQQTAQRLIAKYGQSGTITRLERTGGPDYDPVMENVVYPVKLVPMQYLASEIDGTVIQSGDVKLYISSVGLSITPQPGDFASVNGKDYRVINSDPNLYDGQTAVVHVVQARI